MKKLYKIVFYLLCTHTSNAQANYFQSFDRTVNTLSDAVDVLVKKYKKTTQKMIDVEKEAQKALEELKQMKQAQEQAQKELENQLQALKKQNEQLEELKQAEAAKEAKNAALEKALEELKQMKQAKEAALEELKQMKQAQKELENQLQAKGEELQQAQAALQAKGEELEQIKKELEQLKDKQFQHLLQPFDDSQSEFSAHYFESNQATNEDSSSKDDKDGAEDVEARFPQKTHALSQEQMEAEEQKLNEKLDKLNQELAALETNDKDLLLKDLNLNDTAGSKNSNYSTAVDPEEQARKQQEQALRDDAEIDTDSTNSKKGANDSLLSSDHSEISFENQENNLNDFLVAETEVPDNKNIEQQNISIHEKNATDLDIAIQIVKKEESKETIDKNIFIEADDNTPEEALEKLEKPPDNPLLTDSHIDDLDSTVESKNSNYNAAVGAAAQERKKQKAQAAQQSTQQQQKKETE